MNYTIFKQPSEALGTRKHLKNRKGIVEDVEHAYSGIVNVYALVPPGKLSDTEGVSAGTKQITYTPLQNTGQRPKPGRQSKRDIRDEKISKPFGFGWAYNTTDKVDKVYRLDKDGNLIQDESTLVGNALTSEEYKNIIKKGLIKLDTYDESDSSDAYKIRGAVQTIINHPVIDREKTLLLQAMNLHVDPEQMRIWSNNPKYTLDKEGKYKGHTIERDRDHVIRTEIFSQNKLVPNHPTLVKLSKLGLTTADEVNEYIHKLAIKDGIILKLIKIDIANLLEKGWEKNPEVRKNIKKKFGLTEDKLNQQINIVKSEYSEPGGLPREEVIVNTITLPLDITKLTRIDIRTPINNPRYADVPNGESAKAIHQRYISMNMPSPIVYVNRGKDGISYYTDSTLLSKDDNKVIVDINRRRKLAGIKVRRISYRLKKNISKPKVKSKKIVKKIIKKQPVKKCSRSSVIKKCILSKLKSRRK